MNTPGQESVPAVLDAIDAATTPRCAYCDNPIPAGCVSDDFCCEGCERAWLADRHGAQQLYDPSAPQPRPRATPQPDVQRLGGVTADDLNRLGWPAPPPTPAGYWPLEQSPIRSECRRGRFGYWYIQWPVVDYSYRLTVYDQTSSRQVDRSVTWIAAASEHPGIIDRTFEEMARELAVNTGVLTINEARAELGLPPEGVTQVDTDPPAEELSPTMASIAGRALADVVYESALAEDIVRDTTAGLITTVPGTAGDGTTGPLTADHIEQLMAALISTVPGGDGPPYTHTFRLADPVDDDGNQMQGAVPSFTIVDEPYVPPDQVMVVVPVPPGARGVDVYTYGALIGGQWSYSAPCDGPTLIAARPDHVPAPAPPADPMLRAIEARRNRNTGPKQKQRAPRRIDPRRSR